MSVQNQHSDPYSFLLISPVTNMSPSDKDLLRPSINHHSVNSDITGKDDDIFSQFLNISAENKHQWTDESMLNRHPLQKNPDTSSLKSSTFQNLIEIKPNLTNIADQIIKNGKTLIPQKQRKVSTKKQKPTNFAPISTNSIPNTTPSTISTPTTTPILNNSYIQFNPSTNTPRSSSISSSTAPPLSTFHSDMEYKSLKKLPTLIPKPSPNSIKNQFQSATKVRTSTPIKDINPVLNIQESDSEDENDQRPDVPLSSSPTIQIDSPSMHMNNDILHQPNYPNDQIDSVHSHPITKKPIKQHQFLIHTENSFKDTPPTFSIQKYSGGIANNVTNESLPKKNANSVSSISPKPILHHEPQIKLEILKLLRNGLREYTKILLEYSSLENIDKEIGTRTEFLSSYLNNFNFDLKPKIINDYINEIRRGSFDSYIKKNLNTDIFSEEVKQLLNEIAKRRKCYIKLKGSKSTNKVKSANRVKRSVSTSDILPNNSFSIPSFNTPASLRSVNPPRQHLPHPGVHTSGNTKVDKVAKDTNIVSMKIGCLKNQTKFLSIVDLKKISTRNESVNYFAHLRSLKRSLSVCIDDIYSQNMNFNHSFTYFNVPIKPDRHLDINLESDQMISYVEVFIDISQLIIDDPMSTEPSSIIQLKSITKMYDNEKLVYRKCDPITGYLVDTSQNLHSTRLIKVILPLQAKVWSSLINDYSNGIIDSKKFENMKISNILLPNDDLFKFKYKEDPIHSFLWDFNLNLNDSKLESINILKSYSNVEHTTNKQPTLVRLPSQRKQPHNVSTRSSLESPTGNLNTSMPLMASTPSQPNFNSISNTSSNILKINDRGHKRTRSRSMNEIDLMSLQIPFSLDNFVGVSNQDTFHQPQLRSQTNLNAFPITTTPTDSTTSPILHLNNSDSHISQSTTFNNLAPSSLLLASSAPPNQTTFQLPDNSLYLNNSFNNVLNFDSFDGLHLDNDIHSNNSLNFDQLSNSRRRSGTANNTNSNNIGSESKIKKISSHGSGPYNRSKKGAEQYQYSNNHSNNHFDGNNPDIL